MSPLARVVCAAALAAAVAALSPLLRNSADGLASHPSHVAEREPAPVRASATFAVRAAPVARDAGFAPAPQGDPRFPVGVEFCTPSEHHQPASPPIGPETDVMAVIEGFESRAHATDMIEPRSSVRWSGGEEARFEAELVFYRRIEGGTLEHRATWLERKPGVWSLIDYTVQRVSEREDEPVRVLDEHSPEWRDLSRRLAAR